MERSTRSSNRPEKRKKTSGEDKSSNEEPKKAKNNPPNSPRPLTPPSSSTQTRQRSSTFSGYEPRNHNANNQQRRSQFRQPSANFFTEPAPPPVATNKPEGSIIFVGDTASLGLHSNGAIAYLTGEYAKIRHWDIVAAVLAQPLEWKPEKEGGDIDEKCEKLAIENIENVAKMCHIVVAVIVSSPDCTEQTLKLSINAAKKGNPTNICLVLPGFDKRQRDYETSDLTNFIATRSIAAKTAILNSVTVIDPTPPHLAAQQPDETKKLARVWKHIVAELIPPQSKAATIQRRPEKGQMQGLDYIEKKFRK